METKKSIVVRNTDIRYIEAIITKHRTHREFLLFFFFARFHVSIISIIFDSWAPKKY